MKMKTRSMRQSFLGNDSDQILGATTVAVIGTSGGGSPLAQQLAHIGFGKIHLIDPAVAQEHHRHRLIGINSTFIENETYKVEVVKTLMDKVNPEGRVFPHAVQWQEVHQLLKECDLVFSCVDGYGARDEIERYVRGINLPLIDLGMDVNKFENGYQICGQIIMSVPGSHCMRCFGFITEKLLAMEAGNYGSVGGRPQVSWPNGTLACTAVGMAMSYLLPWHSQLRCERYLEYDGNMMTIKPNSRLIHLRGATCQHYTVSRPILSTNSATEIQNGA
jgi:molybdopterin-synthase adenylyltransferase